MRISDWSSDVCSSDLNLARWAQGMGARLADSLDQPVWRQYLRQDLRRLAGLIIKVERHPAAAMPGEEAADRRVILRTVADEDRDVMCLERLRPLLPPQRHLFLNLSGDAPVGRTK